MTPATAPASSCLPEFVALDVVQPLAAGDTFSHYLKSHKTDGVFESDFAIEGSFQGGSIDLSFRFTRGPDLGLPYNLYLVLAATEKEVVAWHDFTAGCSDEKGQVQSVFRGHTFRLPAIKNAGDGPLNLRLLVWGR